MNLSKAIKRLCAEKDVTQYELAEIVGMSEGGFSYSIKMCNLKLYTIIKLTDHFKMKVSEFIALGEDK